MKSRRLSRAVGLLLLAGVPLLFYNNCRGGFNAVGPDSSNSLAQNLPSNEAPPSEQPGPSMPPTSDLKLAIAPLSPSKISAVAGSSLNYSLKIRYSGANPLPNDFQVFVHFVSAANSNWFEFADFPLSGPNSSQWKGDVIFERNFTIPATTPPGTYLMLAGIKDSQKNANVQIQADPDVIESFVSGVIGYRYQVGSVSVSSPPPVSSSDVTGYQFQTLIDDMNKLSDFRVTIVPGPYEPAVVMGSSMRGGALAAWMIRDFPQLLQSFVSQTFPFVQPWYNILAGEGNLDSSTYVEIRNDVTYALYKNGQWIRLYEPMEQTWQGNYWNGFDGQIRVLVQPDGHRSFLIPGNTDQYIHGGVGKFSVSNPQDVIGLHHRLEARLVMAAGAYDRNRTRRLMQVGSDYLPQDAGAWSATVNWYPPSSYSRSREITPQWQVFTTTSVKPKVNGIPNEVVHPPYDSSIKNYISEDELRANPPPGF